MRARGFREEAISARRRVACTFAAEAESCARCFACRTERSAGL